MALSSLRRVVVFVVPPILVAGILLFFGYPPLNEQVDGECSALTLRVMDQASHDSAGFLIVGRLYGSSSSEPSGEAYARDRHPMLPTAVGCALEYWRMAFNPTPPAAPTTAPAAAAAPATAPALPDATPAVSSPPPAAPPAAAEPLASVIARGMTPNGDPISPETVFTLPMRSVAIRVDYRGRAAATLRFQLMQGKAVLATCPAERAAGGTAWCKFNVDLRKGVYSIALTADRDLLGQFPFTVIGR
jgi:hypothetical protein